MAFPQTPDDQRTLRDTGPASNAVLMSVGTTYTQGRAVLINSTVSGVVVIQMENATTVSMTVPAGIYEFNWAVTKIVSSAGTATFYNLY